MKIALSPLNKNYSTFKTKQDETHYVSSFQVANSSMDLSKIYPKSYYTLNFTARVDKDLDSFVQRNAIHLPDSVKYYVENLSAEQKQTLSPLEAQRNAFEYLAICDSVDDIKEMYPVEPLFSDLISSDKTNARRGILFDIRYLKDSLKDENQTVLNNTNEDISVYLVKKIFLEGKTIPEINEDLDNDINDALKRQDKNYIRSSTLKALGIKLPSFSYLTSLRYTKTGYSDMMASKLSKHWKDLSPEQKEKIIQSHSSNPERKLSQEQKERLSKLTKERWEKMSPEQKVDLIDKLQQGSKEQKIVMIGAWNKCPELRKELSQYLYENNYFSPQNIIYNEKPLSEAMKIIMSKFWQNNQKGAKQLGLAIVEARAEYDEAKKSDKLDEYIALVLENQNKNKAEIKAMKASRPTKVQVATQTAKEEREKLYDEYRKDFSFFPDDCFEYQFMKLNGFSTDEVKKFIMFLKNEKLSDEDAGIAKKVCEAICPWRNGKGNFNIESFISTTCQAALTQALEPIVNPVTNEEYKISFPLFSNQYTAFILISRLCYYFSHNDVSEFNLVDWLTTQNNMNEILNSPLDDAYGLGLIDKYCKNPSKVKEVLENYKYNFRTIPNVQTFKDEYVLNELNPNNDYRAAVKKNLIKLGGYNNLKQKDFDEFDKILTPQVAYLVYAYCFAQKDISSFTLISKLATFVNICKQKAYPARIFDLAMLNVLEKELKKLDEVCNY